jgi:hypothetical protein
MVTIFVNPLAPNWEMPLDDHEFKQYFAPHIKYGDYTVWKVLERNEDRPDVVEIVLPMQYTNQPQLQE